LQGSSKKARNSSPAEPAVVPDEAPSVTPTVKASPETKPSPAYDSGGAAGGLPAPTTPFETPVPVASCPVYTNTPTQLYCYESGKLRLIGTFQGSNSAYGGGGITDIAINLLGKMYAVDYNALYVVNPDDASLIRVPGISWNMPVNALTFLSDGTLIAAGGAQVFVIDPKAGTTRLLPLKEAAGYSSAGDIIGLPDRKLYWTVIDSKNALNSLVSINPDTGVASPVGTLAAWQVFGLGYHDGKLMGFAESGEMIPINSQNAAVGAPQPLGQAWWGATTNPTKW
jgi:hypothetical protein